MIDPFVGDHYHELRNELLRLHPDFATRVREGLGEVIRRVDDDDLDEIDLDAGDQRSAAYARLRGAIEKIEGLLQPDGEDTEPRALAQLGRFQRARVARQQRVAVKALARLAFGEDARRVYMDQEWPIVDRPGGVGGARAATLRNDLDYLRDDAWIGDTRHRVVTGTVNRQRMRRNDPEITAPPESLVGDVSKLMVKLPAHRSIKWVRAVVASTVAAAVAATVGVVYMVMGTDLLDDGGHKGGASTGCDTTKRDKDATKGKGSADKSKAKDQFLQQVADGKPSELRKALAEEGVVPSTAKQAVDLLEKGEYQKLSRLLEGRTIASSKTPVLNSLLGWSSAKAGAYGLAEWSTSLSAETRGVTSELHRLDAGTARVKASQIDGEGKWKLTVEDKAAPHHEVTGTTKHIGL